MTTNEQATFNPVGKLLSSIEIHSKPEDMVKVKELVSRFGVCREDDSPEEAANRLASMALALANIAAGHLRGRADGVECDLGLDFVVEGGFAAAEFSSTVIGPVSWIQDRWERNLLHDVVPDAPGRERMDHLAMEKTAQDGYDSVTLPASRARRLFLQSQQEHFNRNRGKAGNPDGPDAVSVDDPNSAGQKTRSGMLMPTDLITAPLLKWRRPTLCREAMEHPVIFSGTATPAGLQSRAARAHLGHLLVHSQIDSADSLEKVRKTLVEFTDRRISGRPEGLPPVRTGLMLCAGADLLDEAVAAGPEQLRGVSSLLWLVESAPGGDLSGPVEGMTAGDAPDFRQACEREIRRRINFTDEDVHDLDALKGRMAAWRSFLREREWHHPGIAATAGNLPLALCFGLQALRHPTCTVDGDEVLALAQWLILRMCNRINMAAANGRDYRTERLATKLAKKLVKYGPMNVRGLMRKSSKMSAGDCRKGLALLADREIAVEQDGVWGIRGDTPLVLELIAAGRN